MKRWLVGALAAAVLAAAVASAHVPGPSGGGAALLPNGRRVTPAGDQVRVGGFPQVMAMSPAGDRLAVGNVGAGPQSISVIDTATLIAQHAFPVYSKDTPPGDPFDPATVFDGLAFTGGGSRLWVSGGSQSIVHAFDATPAGIARNDSASIPLPGSALVGPMVPSADDSALYVVDASRKTERVFSVDLATKQIASVPLAGQRPFALAVNATGVYVAGMLSGDVNRFDSALHPVARAHVAERPMALTLAGDELLVADANRDELVVLDAADLSVLQRVSLQIVPGGLGTSPNAIAVEGSTAVVTLGGANAVAVLRRDAGGWHYEGAIPTGWTPEAVALRGGTIWVANARGEDSMLPYIAVQNYGPSAIAGWEGTVSKIAIPADLSASTQQVLENNRQLQPADTTLLSPSGPIKHVVFILRENKTFDADLGDMPGGDPGFVLFPRPNTPSLHALADRYAVLTDFYANGEASDEGHEWATGGYVTDFVDRFWPAHHDSGYTNIWGGGNDPIEYPSTGYIFDAAEAAGITWRDYGEFLRKNVRGGPVRAELQDNVHPTYPGWDEEIPDTTREAIWEDEFSSTDMPAFSFIYLPNDHGYNVSDPNHPTLQQQVANNDRATGLIVDAISHSPWWPSTAIFITEDDPQSAMDHVESHRTIGMVVSPWAKKGFVGVHSDTSGMIRTMEMILGLAPINSFDANARPFAEAFTGSPDFTPFVAPPEGFGVPPSQEALALAASMAGAVHMTGPDQVSPALQLDYTYLSVYGVTAQEYNERIGAKPGSEDD